MAINWDLQTFDSEDIKRYQCHGYYKTTSKNIIIILGYTIYYAYLNIIFEILIR